VLSTATAVLEPALPPSLLDVHDAAKVLNVSESWIRRHERELPAVRLGRLVRFNQESLNQHLIYPASSSGSGKSLGKVPVEPIQRRYQNGSLQKRGQIWYGVFRADTMDADGKLERKQKRIRLGSVSDLPTKHAAKQELQKHMTASKPTTEMTLQKVFERWQAAVVPTLKTSTANVYTHSLNSRILPTLGKTPISKIGRYEIELFLAGQGKKYARNTLRELRSSLSRVLSWAAVNNWIEKNPVQGIKLPKGTGNKRIRNVLTPPQIKALVDKLEEPYASLILFLAVTGLRIGEAVGVKWQDFKDEVLTVQRRIYEGKADTLKTDKSKRPLPIPASLMERLKTLGSKSQWVFSSASGTPLNPGNVLRRYVQPLARKLGIPLSGFHDLRHTLATDLINSGVSAKAVSEILGHANVGITLNTYTHPAFESFEKPLKERAGQFIM
jgi:integrase